MLLHKVEAARPVHASLDLGPLEWFFEHVSDAISLVHHVTHGHAVETSEVERLPAGGGIKRCPVQVGAPAAVSALQQAGVKMVQVTIVVVQPFRHGSSLDGDVHPIAEHIADAEENRDRVPTGRIVRHNDVDLVESDGGWREPNVRWSGHPELSHKDGCTAKHDSGISGYTREWLGCGRREPRQHR